MPAKTTSRPSARPAYSTARRSAAPPDLKTPRPRSAPGRFSRYASQRLSSNTRLKPHALSGFFLKKKPPCTIQKMPHKLENRSAIDAVGDAAQNVLDLADAGIGIQLVQRTATAQRAIRRLHPLGRLVAVAQSFHRH